MLRLKKETLSRQMLLSCVFGVSLALLPFSNASLAQDDGLPPQPAQSAIPEEDIPPPADVLTEVIQESVQETPDNSVAAQVVTKPVPHSGQYYDADSIVPSASLRDTIGPREVDPRYEPGSSFVVVRKKASAGSREAQIVAAQRALSLGRYSSALEIYEGLYKKSPRNKQVLMGLAVAQQKNGFADSAISTYEELLKIDSNNTDATVNMLGLIQKRYPSVAYRKLRDLWENNSQNPALAAQLGLTSASVGNYDEAVRYLGVAASLEPANAGHVYNMAVVTDQAGAYKDAIELYQKALEVDIAHGAGRSIPRDEVYDRLADLRRL